MDALTDPRFVARPVPLSYIRGTGQKRETSSCFREETGSFGKARKSRKREVSGSFGNENYRKLEIAEEMSNLTKTHLGIGNFKRNIQTPIAAETRTLIKPIGGSYPTKLLSGS
ncbi:MAG TPA: hypothetical protein VMV91_12250 [Rhodocyclaceae bacterium]|nr:hypothetical protein [Rhodocyclaceae bacterium]